MAIFQFFKMTALCHLGFSKVGNFNFRSHSEAQYASPYQISRRSVKPFRWYGRFSIFQHGGCRHLGFCKFQILTVGTVKRVELRLYAKFCRNRSNRGWDMAIFPFFKMAAVRLLGFSKVGNFNFRSHSEAQYASSYQISRRSVEPFQRYGRFSVFQDGGRPPSWIGFTRVYNSHLRSVLGGLCDCKFGVNRCSNFDSMQILIFCTLSLKMPIHATKIRCFGGILPPKCGAVWTRPPKGTSLGGNTSYDV